MNNNLKVLRLFVDNKDKTFTIKKAAEALKINYRIAYEEIMELEKEGLLRIARHGNSKVCGFIHKYCSKVVEVEEARKQELFKDKNLTVLCRSLDEIKSPFYILALFGSYAKGTNRKGSDIDLCIISDSPEVIKEAHSIVSITALDIHLLDFTSGQFSQMVNRKNFNVGNEIVLNSIILHGLEGFYQLVNNAQQLAYPGS